MTEITPEALEALSKKATQGVWSYRPDEYDDWGIVRGEEQDMGWEWKPRPIIAQFRGRQYEAELSKHRKAKTDPWKDDPLFVCALVNAYRTGQLILAQPSGDEVEAVEAVARAVAEYQIGVGLPADDAWEDAHGIATAAITALDAVRGKQ